MVVFSSAYSSVTKLDKDGKKYTQEKGYTLKENNSGKKTGKVHYKDSKGKKINRKIVGPKSKFNNRMKSALKKIGWEDKNVNTIPRIRRLPRPKFIFSPDSIVSRLMVPSITIRPFVCKKRESGNKIESKSSDSKSSRSKSSRSKSSRSKSPRYKSPSSKSSRSKSPRSKSPKSKKDDKKSKDSK